MASDTGQQAVDFPFPVSQLGNQFDFLFNSLSTLRSMIYSGDQNAEQFVIRLSEVYRRLLQIQEKEAVTLAEELQFADDYSFMLFARFEGMLFISKNIDDRNFRRH